MNPIDFGFKGQGRQGQMFQNHFKLFKEQFPEMIFVFIYLCNLFELTYQVVQNICDKKKSFRRYNVLQTSLVLLRIVNVYWRVFSIFANS